MRIAWLSHLLIDMRKFSSKPQSSHEYEVQVGIEESPSMSEAFGYAHANPMLCTCSFVCEALKVCLSERMKQVLTVTSLRIQNRLQFKT